VADSISTMAVGWQHDADDQVSLRLRSEDALSRLEGFPLELEPIQLQRAANDATRDSKREAWSHTLPVPDIRLDGTKMCSSEEARRGVGQTTLPAPAPSSHWTGTRDILMPRKPNVNHIQKKMQKSR
jgi:hypothetical protein